MTSSFPLKDNTMTSSFAHGDYKMTSSVTQADIMTSVVEEDNVMTS